MTQDIKATVKGFILKEFLPGEDPEELTDTTPLISGGILDSIATIKLVLFLEEKFGVVVEAHETDPEYIDTIESIAQLVSAKQA